MTILDRLLDLEKNPAAKAYTAGEYDLPRYAAWLAALGSPQEGLHFLHIAGTKGKGSTAALCEALLRGLGFPTAMFTSPHLEHYGERFRFDGVAWTQAEFEARLTALYESMAPEVRRTLEGPEAFRTVFETLTTLALVEFRRRARKLQAAGGRLPLVVVWETGLGGRLDCTNVVAPMVACITTLGMDHMAILGNSIEAIAAEKAGIMKPGVPCVVSRQPAEFRERVWPVLTARAAAVGAPIVRAWQHNEVVSSEPIAEGGQRVRLFLPDGRDEAAVLPLLGRHQTANLESAVAACWYIAREFGVPTLDFLKGLPLADWPGRFEIHRRAGRVLVLDGAHCPLSARRLGETLREMFEAGRLGTAEELDVALLWGMQRDKSHGEFLAGLRTGLAGGSLRVIAYPVGGLRGAPAEDIAKAALEEGLDVQLADSPAAALAAAQNRPGIIAAAGTLYTIAALRKAWDAG